MKPNRTAPGSELVPNIEALEHKLVQNYLPGLRDRNPRIRRKAARALGYLGRAAADAVPALNALREDDNPAVRGAARWALARIAGSGGRESPHPRHSPRTPLR
jgi:HEAT repeat protein